MKKNSLVQGAIFKALLLFSIPMIITNTVSILFHAADVAVLALLVDGNAVAAVGACGSIITLLVSIFTGLSVGANVLISKRVGAGDAEGTSKAVGTSLVIGLLSGIVLMTVGCLFSRQILVLMNCQEDVLDMATLYMTIYFAGMPIRMLNSFATAVLRSSGDSVRPMYYMIISGITNVGANFFFVAVCNMTVEGVALATMLSSALTLSLTLIRLFRDKGICRVEIRQLRIRKEEFFEIVRVGVPTCFCSIFFYIASVVLTSCVNSMSTEAMTASSISGQFDGVIYTIGAAIASATSVMVAQNYGAHRLDRVKKTIRTGIIFGMSVSLTLGITFVLLSDFLLGLLSDSPRVIAIAKERMTLLCLTYFVTTIMEVLAFSLRSLKRQKSTMVVGAICGMGMRCLWAWFVWPLYPTLWMLYSIFVISAFVAIIIYIFVYIDAMRKFVLEEQGCQPITGV